MWKLRAEGHFYHSGLPHKGINSLELCMEAIAYIQRRFYQEIPPVRTALSLSLSLSLSHPPHSHVIASKRGDVQVCFTFHNEANSGELCTWFSQPGASMD